MELTKRTTMRGLIALSALGLLVAAIDGIYTGFWLKNEGMF